MKKRVHILLPFFFLLFAGCRKFDFIYEKATVRQIDWCLMFVTEKRGEEVMYEPFGLDKFDIQLEDGDVVVFRFVSKPFLSVCQMGEEIELYTLRKK